MRTRRPMIPPAIQYDPDIFAGTLVFTGTGVPVRTLLDHLEAGNPLEEFLDQFPSVSREQAVTVLQLIARNSESQAYPCPQCGRDVHIDLSPGSGDAVCPHCGQLFWRAPRRSHPAILFVRF